MSAAFPEIDPAEFDEYNRRIARHMRVAWFAAVWGSAAVRVIVGVVWSLVAAIVFTAVALNLGLALLPRLAKAMWGRRFPVLRNNPAVVWTDADYD